MSWDVVLMNVRGGQRPVQDLDDDDVLPLGGAAEVRSKVSVTLPGTDWSNPSWGSYRGDGFSIEFNAGKKDPIAQIMLHVRGGGSAAVAAILRLCADHSWSALDCSTSEFIDPADPSHSGWEGFQRFRDKVIDPDTLA